MTALRAPPSRLQAARNALARFHRFHPHASRLPFHHAPLKPMTAWDSGASEKFIELGK
jgi:hypothetical protein